MCTSHTMVALSTPLKEMLRPPNITHYIEVWYIIIALQCVECCYPANVIGTTYCKRVGGLQNIKLHWTTMINGRSFQQHIKHYSKVSFVNQKGAALKPYKVALKTHENVALWVEGLHKRCVESYFTAVVELYKRAIDTQQNYHWVHQEIIKGLATWDRSQNHIVKLQQHFLVNYNCDLWIHFTCHTW